MPRFEVTLEDGRKTEVISSVADESRIKKQANHQEISRCVIANRQGHPPGQDVSMAVSVRKIKD